MGIRFWPSGARLSCLEVLSAACLGLHFGQRADAQVSRCTVFYDRICSSITFGVHVLHSWQMLRQVEIVKKLERGYTFCIHSTCATYQMLLCLVCLDMFFVLHAPLGFEQKSALDPSFLSRNSFANMLTTAKTVMHGTFCFAIEKVAEPFGFKEKLCFKHVFSVRKPMMRRQFQSKTEVCGAMASSGPSQGRDLANPLGSEASILRFIIN